MNLADMNYIEILKNKVIELEKENKELKRKLKDNEADWRYIYINSTEYRDKKIEELEEKNKDLEYQLEIESEHYDIEEYLKEIERLKKDVDDLDAINKELLEEITDLKEEVKYWRFCARRD